MPVASLALAALLATQAATPDPGLSEAETRAWFDARCPDAQSFSPDVTHFPFSVHAETHLLCRLEGYQVMASLADGQLLQVEIRGDLSAHRPAGDPAMEFGHLHIWPEEALIHDTRLDRILSFTELNHATILALWDNPAWSGGAAPTGPWFIPDEIRFGATIAETEAALEGQCGLMATRPIDEVWLLTAPQAQHQTDCFGYDIAGYPRKLELVYGDGVLEQVWLMVGPADIARLRAHFTAIHGAPTAETDRYIVFADWTVAVRKDVPEILLGSDRLQAIWRVQGN